MFHAAWVDKVAGPPCCWKCARLHPGQNSRARRCAAPQHDMHRVRLPANSPPHGRPGSRALRLCRQLPRTGVRCRPNLSRAGVAACRARGPHRCQMGCGADPLNRRSVKVLQPTHMSARAHRPGCTEQRSKHGEDSSAACLHGPSWLCGSGQQAGGDTTHTSPASWAGLNPLKGYARMRMHTSSYRHIEPQTSNFKS